MKRAARGWLLAAHVWLFAAQAAAQAPAPQTDPSAKLRYETLPVSFGAGATVTEPLPKLRNETLRISFGAGVTAVVGPELQVNDQPVEEDNPGGLPLPSLVVRFDIPVHSLILLGVQSAFFGWETGNGELFGEEWHTTLDVGAVVRGRFVLDSGRRQELLLSLPFGPSFDFFDLGPRRYGAELENDLGWHAGLIFGYQYLAVRGLGFFLEGGFSYHHISKTIEYPIGRDELLYQPVDLFVRGGGVLLPAR